METKNNFFEFDAVIEGDIKGGSYIRFPYNIRGRFGKGRIKVRATFDDVLYIGSIVNMGVKNSDGSVCYIIGVLKEIRNKINKQLGDCIKVTITIIDEVNKETNVDNIKKTRCAWVTDLDIDSNYHDNEWGKPVHDDRKLFEMLVLESFQSGLSWITILKKRADFRIAFDNFEPSKVAMYDENKIRELVVNEKIVRHRGKILAAINNAKLFLELQAKYGSFDKFIWRYVDYKPIARNWDNIDDIPTSTELSNKISKDLKKLGFKFLGTTTIYAFMQATGMVNDHTKNCYLYEN